MQRKVIGGSVSFNRNWVPYRDGFGSATGNDNYWLGLDKIYRLVQLGNVTLRIEVQCADTTEIERQAYSGVAKEEGQSPQLSPRRTGYYKIISS